MTETNIAESFTRQRAKIATRARVLKAARELFAEVGYEKATIRAIAKRAGMSTGAFFASFESKADAYEEITGHPPVPFEAGAQLLKIVRSLALNARHIHADEPFGGALDKLVVLARGRMAKIWPEGLKSDVLDGYIVPPADALAALAAVENAETGRAEEVAREVVVTGELHITPGGFLQMAERLDEEEPQLAGALREAASRRAQAAHDRLKARGLVR